MSELHQFTGYKVEIVLLNKPVGIVLVLVQRPRSQWTLFVLRKGTSMMPTSGLTYKSSTCSGCEPAGPVGVYSPAGLHHFSLFHCS